MTRGVCRLFSTNKGCRYGDSCKFSHISPSLGRSESESEDTANSSSSNFSSGGVRVLERNAHIKAFFRAYPTFTFNEEQGAISEWRRLCAEVLDVDPDNREEYVVRKGRRDLNTALVRQFNVRFGTDENDIASWQALCHVLDIPAPDTLEACRESVLCTHVNLVDLTEAYEDVPTKFKTEKALSEYCIKADKIFLRDHAEAGGLLVALLRHIFHPRAEEFVRKQAKRGRR